MNRSGLLTDEEKDALCAVVWGKSGMDAESDEWIYGSWEEVAFFTPRGAYSDGGLYLHRVSPHDTVGSRWRFESQSMAARFANDKMPAEWHRCVYSRAGQHRVVDVDTSPRETYVYSGHGDVMLMRIVHAEDQPQRRDVFLPPDRWKEHADGSFLYLWIMRRID